MIIDDFSFEECLLNVIPTFLCRRNWSITYLTQHELFLTNLYMYSALYFYSTSIDNYIQFIHLTNYIMYRYSISCYVHYPTWS